jgi:hypothetical protein
MADMPRFRNLHVQLLSSTAQQAAMRGVLHQCMLKAVDCLGRPAALKDQFGSDEADERCLQLVFGKTGDGTQQVGSSRRSVSRLAACAPVVMLQRVV